MKFWKNIMDNQNQKFKRIYYKQYEISTLYVLIYPTISIILYFTKLSILYNTIHIHIRDTINIYFQNIIRIKKNKYNFLKTRDVSQNRFFVQITIFWDKILIWDCQYVTNIYLIIIMEYKTINIQYPVEPKKSKAIKHKKCISNAVLNWISTISTRNADFFILFYLRGV